MSDTMTTEKIDLQRILTSMRFESEVGEPVPMLQDDLQTVTTDVSDKDRFISGMAALLLNLSDGETRFDKGSVQELIARINTIVSEQVNQIIHNPKFKALEANWLSLDQLIKNTKFSSNIVLDFIDVGKDELAEDFENNAVDISGSELFKKLYVAEYDSFGGQPMATLSVCTKSRIRLPMSSGCVRWVASPPLVMRLISAPFHLSSSAVKRWKNSQQSKTLAV